MQVDTAVYIIVNTITAKHPIIILSAAAFTLFLPFSGKPFHIDSPVTIYIARQLRIDPLDPPSSDFGRLLSNWNHTELPEESAFHATPHPPIVSYWLAPFIGLFGEKEAVLNWAFFPFFLGAILYFYLLCGLFRIRSPLSSSLLFAVSPVLLVNAQNLMYDVPLSFFAIASFYHLFRDDSPKNAFLAGLFTGLACLTKFTAGTLLLAEGSYLIIRGRWKNLFVFTVPAAGLNLIWLAHNIHFLGGWQLTQNGHAAYIAGDLRYRLERMVAYIGGGFVLPVFPLVLWWMSGRNRKAGCALGAGTFTWSALLMTVLDYSWTSAAVYWCCSFAGSILILQLGYFISGKFYGITSGPQHTSRNEPPPAKSVSLRSIPPKNLSLGIHTVLQISGGMFLTLYAARYSLVFIFVFIILFAKAVESWLPQDRQQLLWRTAIPLSLITSLLLSISDYRIVNAEKTVAEDIAGRYGNTTVYFKGRLGYLYYMHAAGAAYLSPMNRQPAKGDVVVKDCFYNDDTIVVKAMQQRLELVDSLSYPLFPLRTIGGRAGFYGNDRLPYAWVTRPSHRTFLLYRVVR